MKALIFISQVLLLTGLVLLIPAFEGLAQQYKPYNTFNKKVELQRFVEQGGKVEELSPNVYRLTYRTGESRVFNLNRKENVAGNNNPVDTTIINVWEIDTTKFNGLFKYWQQVPIASAFVAPIPIEDLNNNGRPEIYGYGNTISPNYAGPVRIFERNATGIFQEVYTYDPSTIFVRGIADMNGDGRKEICFTTIEEIDSSFDYYPVYRSDSAGSFPSTYDFLFYLERLQINDMFFGDYDNNGIIDCAVITGSSWEYPMCTISEYQDSINNFRELFRYQSFNGDLSGFAIGDFNLNSKTELVISSGLADVFVIENTIENEYSIVQELQAPEYNAYMITETNDLDGNGKPEFWIAGQDFVNGITRVNCYEWDGINNYKIVAYLELRYLVSLSTQYLQAADIDGDEIEELIFSIGNSILVLKFTGTPGEHQYEIFYAKFGEVTQPSNVSFMPVAISDLDGDGKKDLVIPMTKYTTSITYAVSYILKQDKLSDVSEPSVQGLTFEIIQGYPNPFNSGSTISFNITQTSNVQIKIYNSLGKEINQLLNKELSQGSYSIPWDAKDTFGNSLPSGFYLIVLKTRNTINTFKSVLLK